VSSISEFYSSFRDYTHRRPLLVRNGQGQTYLSGREFNYFDDYKSAILECPTCHSCHWKGTFEQGFVEYYAQLMDTTCPRCDILKAPILAIVSYPSLEEARANSDRPGIREWVQQIDSRLDLFEAQKLRTVSLR
jgi:hypothetical protein